MIANTQVGQIAAALFIALTPWIVIRIAIAAATRHWRAVGGPTSQVTAATVLGRATGIAALAAGTFAAFLPTPSAWMALVNGGVFAGLSAVALRALHDLDNATQATRLVDSTTREASLVPRRRHHYLSAYWRALLFALTIAGVATFAWRLTTVSSGDRRLFLPVLFALTAAVFLWLYEVWIRDLVAGPTILGSNDADHERRRLIRLVFASELILVTGFLALAHGLLDVDWAATGGWAAIAAIGGGVLGVIGCSLALSSDLITRRYRAVR